MFSRKVKENQAIIRTGFGGTKVAKKGKIRVVPVLHWAEAVDLSTKFIKAEARLPFSDEHRKISCTFELKMDEYEASIISVAQTIGTANTFYQSFLQQYWTAVFVAGLRKISPRYEYATLKENKEDFEDDLLKCIGMDLNGYRLEGVNLNL